MLSFKKSDFLVASVKNGAHDGKHIYYHDKIVDNKINNGDVYEMLGEDSIRKYKKKMSVAELKKLQKSLTLDEAIDDEMYNKVYEELKTKNAKCIKIFDDGIITCTPKKNISPYDAARHQLIAGPTGSGKSYKIAQYLTAILKPNSKKNIYLFSDVESDPVLDKLKFNLKRIMLNNELIDNPIQPKELENSICIFDDIDSISDKKLKTVVETLLDSLLKRGRHEGIEIICTSHLLTDYKRTRVILSEVSFITLFCRSGSSNSIQYLLSKYVGLSKKQISDIFNINARSVTIFNHYPKMVISDKEIYIL